MYEPAVNFGSLMIESICVSGKIQPIQVGFIQAHIHTHHHWPLENGEISRRHHDHHDEKIKIMCT